MSEAGLELRADGSTGNALHLEQSACLDDLVAAVSAFLAGLDEDAVSALVA